jgi:hypothetical protein
MVPLRSHTFRGMARIGRYHPGPYMRLVTYDRGGARRLGAWVDGTVVDLPDAVGHPSFPATMERLVEHARGTILDAARDALSQPDVDEEFAVPGARLMLPLLPRALRGTSGARGAPLIDPETGLTVIGPDEELPWPTAGGLDMELEVACVIRGGGRNLTRGQAERAIFGYTILGDWSLLGPSGPRATSARNGRRSNGHGGGRRYVGFSLGPCIVTADEFDLAEAAVEVRIDGERRSKGRLIGVRRTFVDVVRRTSCEQGIAPGDLLGSGTSPGGRRPRWDLRPGATIEVDAEGIGVLRIVIGKRARSLVHRR